MLAPARPGLRLWRQARREARVRFFAPSLQLGSSAAVQTMEAAAASFQPEPITTPSRVLEIERLPYATSVNAPIASVSHDEVVEAGRHLVVEARVRLEAHLGPS